MHWHLSSAACTGFCFISFLQELWISVFEISANSTSLVFFSASVYSAAKFSLSKMKEMYSSNTLNHIVYTQKVLWAILQSTSQNIRKKPTDHSLPWTFSPGLYSHTSLQLGKYLLHYFGTATNTWFGHDFSLLTHKCCVSWERVRKNVRIWIHTKILLIATWWQISKQRLLWLLLLWFAAKLLW